jgi:hypothetical protein
MGDSYLLMTFQLTGEAKGWEHSPSNHLPGWANCQQIYILHGSSRGFRQFSMARQPVLTCFHCPGQIAPIRLTGSLVSLQRVFQVEMAEVNVAIQEDRPNALALVTCGMKA